MYKDLRLLYWWPGIKKDVGNFVAQCLTCQQVKAEYRLHAGKLQSLKWERITMYFVVGLPRSQAGHDAIMVIVDRLTKIAHLIPIHTTCSREKLAQLYLDEIVRLHGVPISIALYRDPRFASHFCSLLEAFGIQLDFSTTFHL